MSLAFDKPTDQIQRSGFDQANMWIYNNNNNTSSRFNDEDDDDDDDDDRDSSSSSSIGNNSDASGGGGDSDDEGGGGGEVQSLFKGSLNNLCDLENALPIKESTFAQMTFLCVLLLTLYLITLSMSNMVNSDGFKPYQHHAALINISFAGVFGACIVAKVATYVGELRWARGLGFVACGVAIVSCLLLVFAVYLH